MFLDELLSNPYLAHFLASPSTIATLVGLSLVAVVLSLLARRRRLIVLATGIAAAAIGGLTLAPARGWTTLAVTADPVASVRVALTPEVADLWAWSAADGPSNVALFVPFTLCLGLLLRRPVVALLLSGALSVLIESYQAATGTRIGVFADVVSNSLGAAIGAVAASVVLGVIGTFRTRGRTRPEPGRGPDLSGEVTPPRPEASRAEAVR